MFHFYNLIYNLIEVIGIFISSVVMVLVGKEMRVASKKLTYSHLFLISIFSIITSTFFGKILSSLYEIVYPFSSFLLFVIFLLLSIKDQLQTNWKQAFTMAVLGLFTIKTILYPWRILFF